MPLGNRLPGVWLPGKFCQTERKCMFAEPVIDDTAHHHLAPPFTQRFYPRTNPDGALRQQVEKHLAIHPHFRGRSNCIQIRARGGVVRVEGRLPSWYLKQLLQEAIRRIPGVRRVSNQTSVRDWSHVCETEHPAPAGQWRENGPHEWPGGELNVRHFCNPR